MLLLYNLLSAIALIIYSPKLLLKKGPENRGIFIAERLGRARYARADIWVHAVSVGEVLASLPFLKALKKEFSEKRIVLSTTTYTGQKIARERFPEADRIMYMPWDTGLCIKRVVNALKPEVFIAVETEIWPVLFKTLKSTGARVVILNGRISNTSFTGYRKIKFAMKKVLSFVDFLYMQDSTYAERVIELGADKKKVGVMGNFKFDVRFEDKSPLTWPEKIQGSIMLAASTHRGEEEIILDAFDMIKKSVRDFKLILAPRHPERFDEVKELLSKRGIDFINRSAIKDNTLKDDNINADVIILDTIGELSRVFPFVSVAFIGGSLVQVGGHNIMEPAYWSRPILFGPHMDNFPIAGEFLEKSAAISVQNTEDIFEGVTDLLEDEGKAAHMGRNARSIVDDNTGAVKKTIELLRGYIGSA